MRNWISIILSNLHSINKLVVEAEHAVHACNPALRKWRQENRRGSEGSLNYTGNARTARAMKQDPVLKQMSKQAKYTHEQWQKERKSSAVRMQTWTQVWTKRLWGSFLYCISSCFPTHWDNTHWIIIIGQALDGQQQWIKQTSARPVRWLSG